MLKHLSGTQKKVGQLTPLETGYDWGTYNLGSGVTSTGSGTGSANSFDWIEFADTLGNLITVGVNAYGQIITTQYGLAQAQAISDSQIALGSGTDFVVEQEGSFSYGDTQMLLTIALVGFGLIYISRKL